MNLLIRKSHRWLSIVFTLLVIANTVVVAMGAYNAYIGLAAVVPLLLLLLSGLYLFALPYLPKRRKHVGQTLPR